MKKNKKSVQKKKIQKKQTSFNMIFPPMMPMPFDMSFLSMMPLPFEMMIPFMIPFPLEMMFLPMMFMSSDMSFSSMMPNMGNMNIDYEMESYLNDKYNIREVDKPIEKPNVIKLSKAKIVKTNKTPEEALETVFSLLIPNIDKNKSIFEQGLTNYDVLKIITRCGENGYKLEMKDIFAGPTFNQIVKKLKRG